MINKKRKNEDLNKYLLSNKEFKIYIALEKKLAPHIRLLNYLFENKKIKYSIMIIKATEKSIQETTSYIRKTDIFLKIPYTSNHYLLLLQNTDSKAAIQFGSRLTSLINRTFLINKKTISHKVSLIAFEKTPPTLVNLTYEILLLIKKFKEKNGEEHWVEIKRF